VFVDGLIICLSCSLFCGVFILFMYTLYPSGCCCMVAFIPFFSSWYSLIIFGIVFPWLVPIFIIFWSFRISSLLGILSPGVVV